LKSVIQLRNRKFQSLFRINVKTAFLTRAITDASVPKLLESSSTLQLQFGASPMSPLGIVSDSIAGSHPDPLWNGTILLSFLGKLSLDSKCL